MNHPTLPSTTSPLHFSVVNTTALHHHRRQRYYLLHLIHPIMHNKDDVMNDNNDNDDNDAR